MSFTYCIYFDLYKIPVLMLSSVCTDGLEIWKFLLGRSWWVLQRRYVLGILFSLIVFSFYSMYVCYHLINFSCSFDFHVLNCENSIYVNNIRICIFFCNLISVILDNIDVIINTILHDCGFLIIFEHYSCYLGVYCTYLPFMYLNPYWFWINKLLVIFLHNFLDIFLQPKGFSVLKIHLLPSKKISYLYSMQVLQWLVAKLSQFPFSYVSKSIYTEFISSFLVKWITTTM